MAFTLLNHYLDLADAIEEQNGDKVDYSAFQGTDIPTVIALPERSYLTVSMLHSCATRIARWQAEGTVLIVARGARGGEKLGARRVG